MDISIDWTCFGPIRKFSRLPFVVVFTTMGGGAIHAINVVICNHLLRVVKVRAYGVPLDGPDSIAIQSTRRGRISF